jgi:hypothetical protein
VGDVLVCEADLLDGDEEVEDAPPPLGVQPGGIRDIRLAPDAEKAAFYEEVDRLVHQGVEVRIAEHSSGFPAVEIRCGDLHAVTDILSLEDWRRAKGTPGWT